MNKSNSQTKPPLQGADLRELEMYLVRNDLTKTLGNLYRIVTFNGHVRWVCQQYHHDIRRTNQLNICIDNIRTMGGIFYEDTNQI